MTTVMPENDDLIQKLKNLERKLKEHAISRIENNDLIFPQSNALFQFVIEHNFCAIAVFDYDLNFIYTNTKYLEINNLAISDITDKKYYDIFMDLNHKWVDINNMVLKGEVCKGEDRSYPRISGSLIRWEHRPWFKADNSIGGLIMYSEIINYSESEIEELNNAKNKAEENDRLKTLFLQNITHELRSPMNVIIGFSELLLKSEMINDKQKRFAEIIAASSNQLLNIINDIFSISTLETKQVKLNINSVDLHALLNELKSAFFDKAAAQNTVLSTDRQYSSAFYINSDEEKLKQILTNLLSNAVKYTNSGFIEFGYSHINDDITFYVKDTGIGIDPELHQRIFDPFIQADSSKTKNYGGTGLGLSIAKELVDLLQGKIWVESESGNGSTFYFSIPFIPLSIDIDKSEERAEKIKNPVIMVAEDEEANFLLIEESLSDINVTLIHARNGKEAVEFCENIAEISFIIMDLRMPVMSGYEATKIIKKIRPDLPIMAYTAYALPLDIEHAKDYGFSEYYTKPIKASQMKELIKKYFD